jgi:hypothetical protein
MRADRVKSYFFADAVEERRWKLCLPVGQVEDALQAKRGLGRPFIFSSNFLVILVVEHALSGVQPPARRTMRVGLSASLPVSSVHGY